MTGRVTVWNIRVHRFSIWGSSSNPKVLCSQPNAPSTVRPVHDIFVHAGFAETKKTSFTWGETWNCRNSNFELISERNHSKRMMLHESYHDAKKIQVLKNMSFKQKEDKDIMNDSWHLTRFVGWGYIQGTISSFRIFSCKKKIEDPFSRTCSNFCVPKLGSQKLKNLKKDCEFQHVFSTTNPCSNLLVRVP